MTTGAWGVLAGLWLATLTAFRRDAAAELVLAGVVFLACAASSLRSARPRCRPLAVGLLLVAVLGAAQWITQQSISPVSTALDSLRWLTLAAWCWLVQREIRAEDDCR